MNRKPSSPESSRFHDEGQPVHDFMDEMLVVCPRCSGRAISRQSDPDARPGWFSKRRLVCTQCSYSQEWKAREIRRNWRGLDDYYRLPLLLQAPCCGETLWAYNERHLAFLEDYVAAPLRERRRDPETGWANSSMASRLPQWMTSGKNRRAVLKALTRLRMLLAVPV
ncbi:TFIIB-type zinc ribbon-containing protein [Luteolibacter luteus]|uniref:TFIIB-type zinc ribbon-containing protein n=1 Tax=Luteolibacter luteus TaxID=2728835 RepID=A0A858RPM3_9BACT|nr:TFIIB-type zinc ribbon-containing protein [Luteolibacter luteus]QJE98338.1 TFIIB-type zinc ribbon-containing protein [Luteolibacter luteus]